MRRQMYRTDSSSTFTRSRRLTLMDLAVWLLFVGIVMLPIYLFPSGQPQFSHAVLGAGGAIIVFHRRLRIGMVEKLLLALLVLVVLRECVGVMNTHDFGSFMPALFLMFNLLMLFT